MQLKIQKLENVIFRVGPLREQNGLYDNGTLLEPSKLNNNIPVSKTFVPDKQPPTISNPVFYLGVLYSCWGNCITDNLKHLWPLAHPEQYPILKDCIFAYSEVKLFGKPLPTNYYRILQLLGIPERRLLKIEETTRLSECYLADPCYVQNSARREHSFTQEYQNLIDFIIHSCPRAKIKTSAKVYFTRTNWDRWEYGEKSIEQSFRDAGYAIYSPEKMTFDEMISVLQSSETFASTEGSCAHNSIFLRPRTETLLLRKFDYVNTYQAAINKARDLRIQHINAHFSHIFYDDNDRLGGPFFMYPSKALRNAISVHSRHFPLLEFAKYLCWSTTLHYGHLAGEFIRRHRPNKSLK